MKKIFLNGCYGTCNLGDDIMMNIVVSDLESILDNDLEIYIKQKGNINCLINNKKNIKNLFNMNKLQELILIKNSDLYIWGGGTFLYESIDNGIKSLLSILLHVLTAKLTKTKVVFYGIGFGPFKTSLGRRIANLILSNCDFITVRDKKSFEEIYKLNKKSYFTNDLVYRLNKESINNINFNKSKKHIVINTIYYENIDNLKKFSDLVLKELKIQNLNLDTIHLHLISAWESPEISDLKSNKIVLENLLRKFNFDFTIYENESTSKILSVIKSSDIVFAQRLHILLIGAMLNKVLFTIEYHSKITKFLEDIQYDSGTFNYSNIDEKINESVENYTFLEKYLKDIK